MRYHAHGQDVNALAAGCFCFLNHQCSFPQPMDWAPASTERLWLYHLHYLDWALALALDGSPRCRSVLDRRVTEWLEGNPLCISKDIILNGNLFFQGTPRYQHHYKK